MLFAIPGYSMIADGSDYWRSKIRQWECSSPQGLACEGASADLLTYHCVNWSTLKSWYVVLMSSCPGLSAETCQHWADGLVITLPVLEQLPVRRGSGVACALQIQGRQSEFETSWSRPNVGGDHWRLLWEACWRAQALGSSLTSYGRLASVAWEICNGWRGRCHPKGREAVENMRLGSEIAASWRVKASYGWEYEKKSRPRITSHTAFPNSDTYDLNCQKLFY